MAESTLMISQGRRSASASARSVLPEAVGPISTMAGGNAEGTVNRYSHGGRTVQRSTPPALPWPPCYPRRQAGSGGPMSFNTQILLAAVLGVGLGALLPLLGPDSTTATAVLYLAGLLSGMFIALLKMIMIPLVFSSIAVGVA